MKSSDVEQSIAHLVRRELGENSPPVSPRVVNDFPLVVLLLYPWPNLFDALLEAGIARQGRRPSFRCRDCYFGMPAPSYHTGEPKRAYCVLGCLRSCCQPFSVQAADGIDRFFVTHSELFFGGEASPELLAVTTQRILTLGAGAFNGWLKEEMDRVLFGRDEAGRAWLLRTHLSLRRR